ncbi:MAG: phospholipase [Clostridia bacterium]|nr:phospholipase [Clostridia bacterium]
MSQPFDVKRDFLYGHFESEGLDLPYRYFIPLDYDPGKTYPLLLFLHGAGERGTDNERQLIHVMGQLFSDPKSPVFQSIVLVPQCPENSRWAEADWAKGSYDGDDSTLASPALRASVALVRRTMRDRSVDPAHVYVMGISMGGYGTWYLLTHFPDLFAGGVPICGGGNPALAKNAAPLAIHAFHSSDDSAVPVEGSRTMASAVKAAGGTRMRYTEYNYTGHGSWVAAAQTPGLLEWLFAQTRTMEK